MSIKIASMKFGDCDTIMHNTPNGMKNIAEVLGPNGEVYWSAIKELTGVLPLSIRSNGTMLLDYLISGNMSQTGTPTPDNPIQPQEGGERTGNLLDRGAETKRVYVGTDGEEYRFAGWCASDYIPLDASTAYYISISTPAGIAPKHCFYDANKEFISYIASGSRSFTTPANAAYGRFSYTTETGQVMLNEGRTALPYEPYGYKIPISSAGQTTNVYLGGVQSERQIYKYVFKGNETIAQRDGSHIYYYTPHGGSTMMTYSTIVCSHYIYHNGNAMDAPDNSVFSKAGAGRSIWIRSDTHTDATAFKSYLAQQYAAGTPVTIWYVLAEPETAVVNEPLRKIGDYADTVSMEQAGVQIPTNKGNTVIDVETTLKPSQMYIKYK